MVYKKRKVTTKKKWQKRGAKAGGVAYEALKIAKQVKRMVNVEYKYTYDVFNGTFNDAGLIKAICIPTQGDTQTSRDGNSIKLMNLSGRIFIRINPLADATAIRLIIFRGKSEQSTFPTISSYFETGAGQIYQAPKDPNFRYNTKTIYDHTYNLDKNGNMSQNINWSFKLFGHTTFVNATTNIADGGLYMILVSNESTNLPTMQYTLKTTFTDN